MLYPTLIFVASRKKNLYPQGELVHTKWRHHKCTYSRWIILKNLFHLKTNFNCSFRYLLLAIHEAQLALLWMFSWSTMNKFASWRRLASPSASASLSLWLLFFHLWCIQQLTNWNTAVGSCQLVMRAASLILCIFIEAWSVVNVEFQSRWIICSNTSGATLVVRQP